MNAKELEKLLREILDGVPVEFIRRVANKSLRYMDAYRKGATGRLAAFANKKYTSHRCLPGSWLTECMADYKAAFGEHAEESMVDVAAMREQNAALGGESDKDSDGEEVANGSEQEGEGESGDDDSDGGSKAGADQDDGDEDNSSSEEESDAAAEVAAARMERDVRRDNEAIAVLEAREAAVPTVEGVVNPQGRSQRRRPATNYAANVLSQRYFKL
jgi:TATA-binding protein-associated factor Taf7